MNRTESEQTSELECDPSADCSSCYRQHDCKMLVVPFCCGVPKRPWELCDHNPIGNGRAHSG